MRLLKQYNSNLFKLYRIFFPFKHMQNAKDINRRDVVRFMAIKENYAQTSRQFKAILGHFRSQSRPINKQLKKDPEALVLQRLS